jgi:CheY-like chemotaxis protein
MERRILVAEDNIYLSEFMKMSLEHLGYEVNLANDGVEAMKLAMAWHPDLVIVDIMMPHLDGFQLVSLIRKNPHTQSIKVLATTAAASATRQQCLTKGFDGYICKPFTTKELEEEIKKVLQGPS